MIKVLGRATSSNVQVVLWCLEELGLTYTREDRGHTFGGVDTPEYLAMNPNGLVPVLIDGDDDPIFESCAIARYLAARYGDGGAFWPTDLSQRAQVDKWAEWGKTTMAPSIMHGVFYPLVRTAPADRDPAKIAKDQANLLKQATLLNDRLATAPWVAGADFTLADIICGHALYRYFTVPWDRPDLPALAAYYARLQERPAFTNFVMVSYESLRAKGA